MTFMFLNVNIFIIYQFYVIFLNIIFISTYLIHTSIFQSKVENKLNIWNLHFNNVYWYLYKMFTITFFKRNAHKLYTYLSLFEESIY